MNKEIVKTNMTYSAMKTKTDQLVNDGYNVKATEDLNGNWSIWARKTHGSIAIADIREYGGKEI